MGKEIKISEDEIEKFKNIDDLSSDLNINRIERYFKTIEYANTTIKNTLNSDNFKKLKEFLDELDCDDVKKFIKLNDSVRLRELAESKKENERRWRIFWEKLGKEYYPFTIYIMFFASGLTILGKIIFDGILNPYLRIFFFFVLLWTPLTLLPDSFWKKFIWLGNLLKKIYLMILPVIGLIIIWLQSHFNKFSYKLEEKELSKPLVLFLILGIISLSVYIYNDLNSEKDMNINIIGLDKNTNAIMINTSNITTITFDVFDKNNRPIENALVVINNLNNTASGLTKKDGRVQIIIDNSSFNKSDNIPIKLFVVREDFNNYQEVYILNRI